MPLTNLLKKTSGLTSRGLTSLTKPKLKVDLSSLEGLELQAREAGLGKQAAEIMQDTSRLSVLQRFGRGLGAFNPAEAILTGKEEGLGAGLLKYPASIGTGLWSAITGKEFEEGRRGFKQVAKEMGIENKIALIGIGFLGDVLLDPTTYFGVAIAKGIGFGIKGVSKMGLGAVGKVAPEIKTGLELVGTGLQDALGRTFQYGFKATRGAKEDILSFLSKKQQAKLGLAASNLDRLGTGILTKSQREELALKLIAGKRAEALERLEGIKIGEEAAFRKLGAETGKEVSLKGTSPEVAKIIGQQAIRSKKFAEQIGLENPYEVYFPFIRKDKLDKFLKETQGIKIGSEGYRKQFKNLLTNENMELDPAKAFFTRESQIVSDNMTKGFLSRFVKNYGKSLKDFKDSDEALKSGYQLIKEKGIFGKPLGYVNQWDAKLIRDSIDNGFQTINMLAKATGFDAMTSLFKRAVTGLFAPFHVRNFVSGQIQNYETLGIAALNPVNMNIGRKIAYHMGKGTKIPSGQITLGGKTTKFSEVMKPFVDRFSGDTFYNADFDMALKSGAELKKVMGLFSKGRIKETFKTVGLGAEAIPFKVGRTIGQFIEHQQKATAYITALGQGKGIKEALRIAESAGFDYRALTQFESQIMRRLIPFYSFTRKNIELQLKTLGENPQRINQVLKFFENLGEPISAEEKKSLPDYLRESIGIKLGDTPEGLKQYISSFGTPIEAFAQLFGQNPILKAISTTNPLLKVPLEIGIGKDTFRQRDLKDVYTANEYKLAPQIIKDLLQIKAVQKPIYETKNGKLIKVGERTAYIADPERLLIARSLFTSRGVSYLDQIFGNDLKGLVKILKTTTGIKPQQIDIEQQKFFTERDKQKALEDLLIRYGKVKRFESVYVPKSNK